MGGLGRRGEEGKMTHEPHKHGWRDALEVAHAAKRCGAKRKSDRKPCQGPAMRNGRCRVHGGLSTGPKTPEGLARSRRSNWKHGHNSAEARSERATARTLLREVRHWLAIAERD